MFSFGNNLERNATFTLVSDGSSEYSVNDVQYSTMRSKLFLVFRWQIQSNWNMEYATLQRYVNTRAVQVDHSFCSALL